MLRRILCIPTGQRSTTVMSNIEFAALYLSVYQTERTWPNWHDLKRFDQT